MRMPDCPEHGQRAYTYALYQKLHNTMIKKAVVCSHCQGIWLLEDDTWTLYKLSAVTLKRAAKEAR